MTQLTEEHLLPHVPSRRKPVLDHMVGQTIKNVTKHMNPRFESYVEKVCPDLSPDQFFSKSGGLIELSFESGLIVGFSSTEYLDSILLYLIQSEDQTLILNRKAIEEKAVEQDIFDDPFSIPINIHNSKYNQRKFMSFIGRKISAIGVIKQDPKEGFLSWRAMERGIVFHFDEDESDVLIFSHLLGFFSASPAILTQDELDPKMLVEMKEYDYSILEEWYPDIDGDPEEWEWKHFYMRSSYEGIRLNIGKRI